MVTSCLTSQATIIKKAESEPEKLEKPAAKEKVIVKPAGKSRKALEDDSAPIKVNESQDMSSIRQKFKTLTGNR